jgi:hypothetical protein
MKTLQWLLLGAVAGVVIAAFRDFDRGEWLPVGGGHADDGPDDEEPILGYDGMDQETLLDWLDDAHPDPATARKIYDYEVGHLRREPVLEALADFVR